MKKTKDKFISISGLANEFHVSKEAIELYGVHRLLLPIPDKKSKPAYRPIDKARLKFVIRAKNADYTIGNIKDLIGVLDLDKNEVDQIEEGLVYCKKKSADLTDNLEDLDALEQINATCDLELLEAYIADLNNLKYGLDITPIKTVLSDPETDIFHAKSRAPIYSHISDQMDNGTPAIAQNKSHLALAVVAGIFLVAITGYLYVGGTLFPDISKNLAVSPQLEPVEMTTTTAASKETDKKYLPETDTILHENDDTLANEPNSDVINLSETDTYPEESWNLLADEPDSNEELFSLLEFPALKNELNSPSADPAEAILEINSAEKTEDDKNTQALLDTINKSREKTPKPGISEIEEKEEVFFNQLVSDLKKKYDRQSLIQKPGTNDATGINTTPDKISEGKETQNIAALVDPNTESQTSNAKTFPTKTSPKKTITASPKEVAPLAVTKTPLSSIAKTSSTNVGVPGQSLKTPKPVSSTIQTGSRNKQTKSSTKKTETSTSAKRNKSASKTATPPKPKPIAKPKSKSEPELKPVPEPKPKTVPQKPANPEALKWAQKSYDSVMSGDAGEAIIAASVAITLDPNLVNAYINRSWAYSKKGLYDRAIQDCDKALAIDNDNALAYNNRGLAFQGKGDMDKAKANYDRACKLGFDLGCKNYQEVVGVMAGNS